MMKIFNIVIVLLTAFFIASCSNTQPYSVVSEEAWFLESDGLKGVYLPMYCIANKNDKGTAAQPRCFKAKKY